jgi:hypothetical protein
MLYAVGRCGKFRQFAFLIACLLFYPSVSKAYGVAVSSTVGINGVGSQNQTYNGAGQTSGSAGLSYSDAPANDPTNIQTGSASGTADLSLGLLTLADAGTYTRGVGTTYALGVTNESFSDTLAFSIPNADPSTVTFITILYHITGSSVFSAPSGVWDEEASLVVGNASWVQYAQNSAQGGPAAYDNDPLNWVSSQISNLSLNGGDFVGIFALHGAAPTLNIMSSLGASAGANASLDFTSTLGLQLPDGVAYTSGSGVFPAQNTAVPEPQAFALYAAALGVFFVMRVRNRTGA